MIEILYLNDIKDIEKLDFVQDKNRIKEIFNQFKFPITLVIEFNYQDRDYKDIYYHYYASKHKYYFKDTIRILLLENKIPRKTIYDKNLKEIKNV